MENKNICNECIIKTGGCCTNANLIIHSSEINPFLEAKTKDVIPPTQSLEKLSDEKDLYFYQTNGERCIFLSSSNACLIYDTRPTICKMYPILWNKTALDPTNIFIDLLCPLAHSVPISDIYKTSRDINIKKMIKKIGPLVFDHTASTYLNINDIKRSSEAFDEIYSD